MINSFSLKSATWLSWNTLSDWVIKNVNYILLLKTVSKGSWASQITWEHIGQKCSYWFQWKLSDLEFSDSVWGGFSFPVCIRTVHCTHIFLLLLLVWGILCCWCNAFSEFLTEVKLLFVYDNIVIYAQADKYVPNSVNPFSFYIHYYLYSGMDSWEHHQIIMSVLKLSISSMLAVRENVFPGITIENCLDEWSLFSAVVPFRDVSVCNGRQQAFYQRLLESVFSWGGVLDSREVCWWKHSLQFSCYWDISKIQLKHFILAISS